MTITGSRLAQLCNVSRQAVSKLNLPKLNGKYDTNDKQVKNYLLSKGVNLGQFKEQAKPTSKPKEPKKPIVKPKSKPITKTEKKEPKQQKKPREKKLSTSKVLPVIEDDEDSEIIKPFISGNELSEEAFEDMTGLPHRMMNLTLMQLVTRYGGPMQLDKWATILQKLMQAQKSDVSIQQERLKLIEKDFVISQVFKYLDVFNNQIFDLAESQAEQIVALVKSNEKEAKTAIKNLRFKGYSKIAKETKRAIENSIKRLRNKHEKSEEDDE